MTKTIAFCLVALSTQVLIAKVSREVYIIPFELLMDSSVVGDHFYTTNSTDYSFANHVDNYLAESARFAVFPTDVASTIQLLQLYNRNANDHLYTTNRSKANNIVQTDGYVLENLSPMFVYETQVCQSVPLYRSYNPGTGDHFYTTSTEMDATLGYTYEMIAGYVLPLNVGQIAAAAPSGGDSAPSTCVKVFLSPGSS
ncbi:hypothetical protein MVEN_00151400 [Mycena venus]|uniref:DUF5648 domain-containing protein n=1 Tax=Mycena venus TaxID=2733690 RepID=A0A8H6Z1R9_9AGAR|nr:hypothetical protein MVEN_00151400 [Mycena venus]